MTRENSLDAPDVSIVVPAHNEEGNLSKLWQELRQTMASTDLSWELVLVDDGSTDSTWSAVCELHRSDPRVTGIRLSRNFGHQNALIAGMSHARGSAVVSMDADLQHPPHVVPRLISEWKKGNKIVKTIRHDPLSLPLFKRVASRYYYRIFSYLSGVRLQGGMSDFRLIDRSVLAEILSFREEGLFLRGIVEWVGYPSSTVEFECEPRFSGATKYSLRKMLRLAWHGISSFSLVPLRIGVVLGLVTSTLSFLGVLYAIISKMIAGDAVAGWASTVAIISFLFGVLFVFLALLAEYVGRILYEVRERPRYLVSERLTSGDVS